MNGLYAVYRCPCESKISRFACEVETISARNLDFIPHSLVGCLCSCGGGCHRCPCSTECGCIVCFNVYGTTRIFKTKYIKCVIVVALYPLLLMVSHKFSISFHLAVSVPRGEIIFSSEVHSLCVAPGCPFKSSLRFGLACPFGFSLPA